MLRPELDTNYNKNDLIFQILDWNSYDEYYDENSDKDSDDDEDDGIKLLKIKGYGVTQNGNSICITINGFRPVSS